MNVPASSQASGRLAGMHISTALKGSALLLITLVGAVGVVSSYGMSRIGVGGPVQERMLAARALAQDAAPPIIYLTEAYTEARKLRDVTSEAEISEGVAQLHKLRDDYEARLQYWTTADLPEELEAAIRTVADGSAADFWDEVENALIPLKEQEASQTTAVADAAQREAVQATVTRIFEEFSAHREEVTALVDLVEDYIATSATAAEGEATQVKILSWAMVGASILVLLLVLRAASILITRPIQSMTDVTGRLAAKDYDTDIPFTDRRNEIGRLATALAALRDAARHAQALEAEVAERNRLAAADAERAAQEQEVASTAFGRALGRLVEGDLTARVDADVSEAYAAIKRDLNAGLERVRTAFAGVGSGMGSIRTMSTELATAAEDLSRRTESQAANLEETAAAVEEITATVKAAADSSAHARQVVSATKLDAEQSGEVVGRAVEAMNAIEASSRQISQIIGVIDEIAFQTNLLALNAGVEAARAGEAGRGFAVVATEVRALAQRSAEAAKQIKDLISASTTQVDQGVDLVGETGKALRRIVTAVAEINELVAGIAAGAAEQSTGLAQVNVAIVQMDKITQQNAAMVEETTAAVRSLAAQTEEVAQKVDRFRTGHDAEAAEWARDARADEAPARRPRAEAPRKLRVAAGASQPAARDDGWQEF